MLASTALFIWRHLWDRKLEAVVEAAAPGTAVASDAAEAEQAAAEQAAAEHAGQADAVLEDAALLKQRALEFEELYWKR